MKVKVGLLLLVSVGIALFASQWLQLAASAPRGATHRDDPLLTLPALPVQPSVDRELTAQGGTIHGMAFHDLDQNGQFSQGEPGVAGATIYLYLSVCTGQPVGTYTTVGDGLYRFEGLVAGTYCLSKIAPPDYQFVSPGSITLPRLGDGDSLPWNLALDSLYTPTPSSTPDVTLTPSLSPTQDLSTPTPSLTPTLTRTPTSTVTVGPSPTPTATPESWLDASGAMPVFCLGEFLGDTTGKPNNARRYGSLQWPETGPEDVYVITKTVMSDLTIELEPLGDHDLDVFLLFSASPGALVDGGYGDRIITVRDLAPQRYYIVVDGYDGARGPYRLKVLCQGEPTVTPTLTSTPTPTNTPVFNYGPYLINMSTPTPTITPTVEPYDVAINCGGPSFQASDGYLYQADKPFTDGSFGWYQGGAEDTWATANAIGNTDDDVLYQSHRYSMEAYLFSVPSGRYEVMLRFAEIFPYANLGDRVFAVTLEGDGVLDHYDLLAQGPKYEARDVSFEVSVTDGALAVGFQSQAPHYTPAINAIRIRRIGEAD